MFSCFIRKSSPLGEVVLDRNDLRAQLDRVRKTKKIVFTNGCFDLLHVGHVRYLQEARALGDLLVVGANSDSSVRKLKGPDRPVQVEGDRAEILAGLACVDFVTIFNEETPLQLIESLMPNVLVKGGDWAPEQIVGSQFVLGHGGVVRSLAFHQGRSTSTLIGKILKTT